MPLTSHQGMTKMYYPFDARELRTPAFGSITINAVDQKIAFGGRIWYPPTTGWKYISRVGFLLGACSGNLVPLRVSLQGMSTTSAPARPNGDNTTHFTTVHPLELITNSWIRTNAVNSSREVKFADRLCVVIEFNEAPSADTVVNLRGRAVGFEKLSTPWTAKYDGSNWNWSQHWPNVVLEFSDGTFGTLDGSYIASSFGTHTFNSGSTYDECGLRFRTPVNRRVDGAIAFGDLSGDGNSDFEVTLYRDTTALRTATIDAHTTSEASDVKEFLFSSEVDLQNNTDYIVAIRATTANDVALAYRQLYEAGHRTCVGDTNLVQVMRADQGDWAADTTNKIPFLGVNFSGANDA